MKKSESWEQKYPTNIRSNKGITLIALVVTIVILLILAGITIKMVTGQNGLISKAQQAADATAKAKILEEVQTKWLELMMRPGFTDLTAEKQAEMFQEELRKDDENATATKNSEDDTKIDVSYKGVDTK